MLSEKFMSFLDVQTNEVNSYRWLITEKLRVKLLKAQINTQKNFAASSARER